MLTSLAAYLFFIMLVCTILALVCDLVEPGDQS